MLIRFRVQKFLSFKDEVEFSMIPGKTRQHPEHIISGGDSRHAVDLLRSGIIYGANASGKSNLIKAIDFARQFIIEGTKARQSIRTKLFKLDPDSLKMPSKFEFEIRVKGKDYLYGFEVTPEKVLSEWLYELKLTTQEPIFERHTSAEDKTLVDFESIKFEHKKDKEFMGFVAMGTRPNQLFLTECSEKNIKLFDPIYQWFVDSLVIIFPETRYSITEKKIKDIELLSHYLDKFGTGICEINLHPVSLQDRLSKKLIVEFSDDLSKEENHDKQISLLGPRGERILISLDEKGEVVGSELAFKHKMMGCQEEVLFDLEEESDGSIRLIDLIPILYLGQQSDKVFLIDELDRSLHPHLCYQLITGFLERESSSTQMIVTTHELNLLTLDLFRRDEIWFVEKDKSGASKMYSLEEFSPRYDKDIQKGYLLGRFGAIPLIGKKQF